MADDLQGNLQNYKLQLQQVEAALTSDPSNNELLKLKLDLEEVIELTQDLIASQIVESKPRPKQARDVDPNVSSNLLDQPVIIQGGSAKVWKAGDKCFAPLSSDGNFYEAVVDNLNEITGEAAVSFANSVDGSEIVDISSLREFKHNSGKTDQLDSKSKKMIHSKQREYQKQKKQKKLQRYKAMEEEREGEKNKWLSFSKKKKGLLKKSIFASPDTVNGRVGVGTCGTSGKPMTEYTTADKYRKGMD